MARCSAAADERAPTCGAEHRDQARLCAWGRSRSARRWCQRGGQGLIRRPADHAVARRRGWRVAQRAGGGSLPTERCASAPGLAGHAWRRRGWILLRAVGSPSVGPGAGRRPRSPTASSPGRLRGGRSRRGQARCGVPRASVPARRSGASTATSSDPDRATSKRASFATSWRRSYGASAPAHLVDDRSRRPGQAEVRAFRVEGEPAAIAALLHRFRRWRSGDRNSPATGKNEPDSTIFKEVLPRAARCLEGGAAGRTNDPERTMADTVAVASARRPLEKASAGARRLTVIAEAMRNKLPVCYYHGGSMAGRRPMQVASKRGPGASTRSGPACTEGPCAEDAMASWLHRRLPAPSRTSSAW